MSTTDHGGTCPYCDSEKDHINNHIRMSTGDHGPQGQYPDDWDSDGRERVESGGSEGSGTSESGTLDGQSGRTDDAGGSTPEETEAQTGQTVHGLSDDPDDTETGATPLNLADDPADAREYDCGECGEPVEYLSEDCGDCGASLVWQGVSA